MKRTATQTKRSQRTVVVVTGTRAEFGLLTPIMRAIAAHPALHLRTIVAGMHLVTGTWRDVRAAGFAIDARVPMQRRDASGRAADVQALARGIAGLGQAIATLRPSAVLVLGDRVEAFAAAAAASVGGVRVAHVHGGDRAEGVADEAMRHAVSKLSHVHFAASALSRRRLVRMGEDARWVFNVGSPAIDALRDVQPAADAARLIVMQHPIGAADADEQRWMRATLVAARLFGPVMVMAPNGDAGAAGIRSAIKQAGVAMIEHLPRAQFLAQLAGARAIVGNSSAGLIEAAALRTACVNIGPRQGGRERPGHVIDCDYGQAHVRRAIERALAMDLSRLRHPYGKGDTGVRIAELLATLDLDAIAVRKRNAY